MRGGTLHVNKEESANLDRALRKSGSAGGQIARIQIWSRAKRVVYSNDHALVGHRPVGPPSDELLDALHGTVGTEFLSASQKLTQERETQGLLNRYGDLLEVYVPIHLAGYAQPVGAFEIYLPDHPVIAAVKADTNRLYLVLLVGLSALYAVVFRLVARASGKLRSHADEIREHARRAEHESLHDPLTGLPNRTLLPRPRRTQAIVATRRAASCRRCLLIDLDRSRRSTTRSATTAATSSCARSRPRLRRRCCARATRSPAWAATSSGCCCSTRRSREEAAVAVARAAARRARSGRSTSQGLDAATSRRQHRDRALPRARRTTPTSCCSAPTSRCTRPRSARTRLRGLRPRAATTERRAPAARRRAPRRRSSSDELVAALPAQGRHALRRGDRRRGAGALAAPRARPGHAGPVHPAGRAQRPDPAADAES